ncbi:MAG: SecA protein [Proteobacteria bacterium]|nr:SecA protein [Pseudomonadota bacterium]
MLQSIFKKVFGSRNDRLVKQYLQKVKAINALEPAMEKLSDSELAGKTAEFKSRLECARHRNG